MVGIIFCPHYYTDFFWKWNCDCTGELPILVVADSPILRRMLFHSVGENLSELDVVYHLTLCTITQEILDNTYPWALTWIDQHISIHFRDYNQQLEIEWQDCICQCGKPVIAGDFWEWWSLDLGDTSCIWPLLFYELRSSQNFIS